MVMSFFRRSDSGLTHVAQQTIVMLGDARHSFDLASTALLSGADPTGVRADIEATDRRINVTEQQLRSELVVHVAVQGADDIGVVMGYTLLLKKIERIGDQAKNLFDLAAQGISLVGEPDVGDMIDSQREISAMYAEVAELLTLHDEAASRAFVLRTIALSREYEDRIRGYLHTDRPGSWAVPRAMLYRYWKRIVANLGGIVSSAIEPVQADAANRDEPDIDD